jgi:sterol desaturase/sphingolipid hydroxylase (fatty acid hydroxylase superfamily)
LNIRGMMRHDKRGTWLVGNHHLLHHQYPRYNYGEVWLDYLGGTLICK